MKKVIKRLRCKKREDDQECLMEEHTKRALYFNRKHKSDVSTRKSHRGRKRKTDDLTIECV